MKKLFYAALVLGLFNIAPEAKAQVRVNINIGSQPQWGPVGYDYARYYYIPEADVYYDVASRRYTYFHGNRWVTRASLPGQFARVDLYRTHKVVINHAHPWKNHKKIRRQYAHFAHGAHHQRVLRDYHGDKRYEKKYHKNYKKSYKKQERGRKARR